MLNKIREIFQQGDLICAKIHTLPCGVQKILPKDKRYVIIEGEHTGHTHAIYEKGWGDMYEGEGKFYIDVKIPVEVRHEEHRPQVILPGVYEINRVREIDPFTEEVRSVQD